MKKTTFILLLVLGIFAVQAQEQHSHAGAKKMVYPNIPGYVTLKTDLHQHTVFSDGNVWPTIRVMEALREDLDAISLTEHLEYQPHQKDIPHPDRNRSYNLALSEAKDHDLLIIHGSEITRSAPVGHSNALFITDANKLLAKDSLTPFNEAQKQKAFVFWNHPTWYAQSPTGEPILSTFQQELIKSKKLHGIEVINTGDFSEASLQLALDNNLTIMSTSDIHGLIDWDFTEKGNHRPITLVFAKERSVESLREALFAGRTVAVFNNLLIGKSEFLTPLLKNSIAITSASYIDKTSILEVVLTNTTSSNLLFENAMPYSFYTLSPIFEIPAEGSITLKIKTLEKLKSIDLKLNALGAYTAPKQHPTITWNVQVKE